MTNNCVEAAGSKQPFYHLGYTAYHLLDISNDDAQIAATLDYCVRHGFNKIRFLLTGYPRDTVHGTSTDIEHGVPAAALKAPNVVYLPDGGDCEINLWGARAGAYQLTWYDPRTGQTVEGGRLAGRGRRKLGPPPIKGDVVAQITSLPPRP